jgi:hypothetical protein
MLTVIVFGYVLYLFGGIALTGYLLNKYVGYMECCIECWMFAIGMVLTFLPFTLLYDFIH